MVNLLKNLRAKKSGASGATLLTLDIKQRSAFTRLSFLDKRRLFTTLSVLIKCLSEKGRGTPFRKESKRKEGNAFYIFITKAYKE